MTGSAKCSAIVLWTNAVVGRNIVVFLNVEEHCRDEEFELAKEIKKVTFKTLQIDCKATSEYPATNLHILLTL